MFTTLALISCQQENLKPQTDNVPKTSGARTERQTPKLEADYLVFEDYASFEAAARSLSNRPSAEKESYENQVSGFVSMRKVFAQAQAEQRKMAEQHDKLSESAKQALKAQLKGKIQYAEYAKQHPNAVKLRTEGGLEINIFNPDFASLTNENGIVKIGKHLYQYTDEAVKVLLYAKEGEANKLLRATQNSADKKIWVMPIVRKMPAGKGNGRVEASNSFESNYATNRRFLCTVNINDYAAYPIEDGSGCPPGERSCLPVITGWVYYTDYRATGINEAYSSWSGWYGVGGEESLYRATELSANGLIFGGESSGYWTVYHGPAINFGVTYNSFYLYQQTFNPNNTVSKDLLTAVLVIL